MASGPLGSGGPHTWIYSNFLDSTGCIKSHKNWGAEAKSWSTKLE